MWYVPGMGKGTAEPYIGNYMLPINSNIGQGEMDASVAGVESKNTSTPVPPVDSEPAEAGLPGMATSNTAGNTPQDSLDQPAPLRHGTHKTQN